MSTRQRQLGLTMIEMVVVVAILAILASTVVPVVYQHAANSRITAAQSSLSAIRDAIVGTAEHPGYLGDTGQMPATIKDLFVKPAAIPAFSRDTNTGWRGPYLLNANGTYLAGFPAAYGAVGDPAIIDAWGNPIVLQRPTVGTAVVNDSFSRLISAGPNGTIDTPQDYGGTPYPPPASRSDDIVLFINHADSYP